MVPFELIDAQRRSLELDRRENHLGGLAGWLFVKAGLGKVADLEGIQEIAAHNLVQVCHDSNVLLGHALLEPDFPNRVSLLDLPIHFIQKGHILQPVIENDLGIGSKYLRLLQQPRVHRARSVRHWPRSPAVRRIRFHQSDNVVFVVDLDGVRRNDLRILVGQHASEKYSFRVLFILGEHRNAILGTPCIVANARIDPFLFSFVKWLDRHFGQTLWLFVFVQSGCCLRWLVLCFLQGSIGIVLPQIGMIAIGHIVDGITPWQDLGTVLCNLQ
mmetsp:Transcript_9377/g.23361  ORF Transcript_9377/g.23361 Transcript_9377/m.23361 type:complete len:272 (+) Transcript_9377:285-1100(+)